MEEEKIQPELDDVVKPEPRDYSNDPFFIKKRERAKEFIDKHGIPENFLKQEITTTTSNGVELKSLV